MSELQVPKVGDVVRLKETYENDIEDVPAGEIGTVTEVFHYAGDEDGDYKGEYRITVKMDKRFEHLDNAEFSNSITFYPECEPPNNVVAPAGKVVLTWYHKTVCILPPPKVGQRVKTTGSIDMFPDYLIDEKGLMGTVDNSDEDGISVKLDKHFDCLNEWDNCIIYGAWQIFSAYHTDFENVQ